KNAWLEVEAKNTANTGLAATDVFYWGNLVGDANLNFSTTGGDATAVLQDVGGPAGISSAQDLNRSGSITGGDATVALQNVGGITRINLTAGAFGPVGGDGLVAAPAAAASNSPVSAGDSGISSGLAAASATAPARSVQP